MVIRVAINGFGRIGRLLMRAGLQQKGIKFVAINDLTDTKNLAYLFKYDTVHGIFPGKVRATQHHLYIDGQKIHVYAEKEPEHLPWEKLKVDVVAECTGFFTTLKKSSKHLAAGAKKVLMSAPCKCEKDDPECEMAKTIVMGVNQGSIRGRDKVISNASCTTNALSPLLKVMDDAFGIKHAIFNTIHSYTATQRLVDGPHKDPRRGRAAAVNLVPTSTGASVAVEHVLPKLHGKLQGIALRIPTPAGSIIQIVCNTQKPVTLDTVNKAFLRASQRPMKGILGYNKEPLVLSDIVHDPHSVIYDAPLTRIAGKNMVSIMGWYDNEWGFSNRMIDVIKLMAK